MDLQVKSSQVFERVRVALHPPGAIGTAMTDTAQHGNRAHARRRMSPIGYVELGQENGGILLNLSEGGLAGRSALALTSRKFAELRFQVPGSQRWFTARGPIVWLSHSKNEAGVQFPELPESP